jgi:hypothetical protein
MFTHPAAGKSAAITHDSGEEDSARPRTTRIAAEFSPR